MDKKKFSLMNLPTEYMMLIVLIILCVILSILKPAFYSSFNVSTLIRTISWTTIVAFGQTLVLLTGGIDLSVAGMAGMSGILSAWFMVNMGIPPFVVIVCVLILAFFCGCMNGVLITKIGMIPFIVTLATGQIFTGVIYVITQGHPILGIPESAVNLGQGMLFNFIPYPTIAMLLLCVILSYVMKYVPFGRYVYAVGGNKTAATIAGVKADKITILVYGISAVMSAVGGILITCRLGTAQPTVGSDWVMPSVTAAAIGGTSLAGGRGTIIGALIGGCFMGVVQNAITILAISAYWTQIITGIIILIAIAIDCIKSKRMNQG
jgi:ribose transport system permease protein